MKNFTPRKDWLPFLLRYRRGRARQMAMSSFGRFSCVYFADGEQGTPRLRGRKENFLRLSNKTSGTVLEGEELRTELRLSAW